MEGFWGALEGTAKAIGEAAHHAHQHCEAAAGQHADSLQLFSSACLMAWHESTTDAHGAVEFTDAVVKAAQPHASEIVEHIRRYFEEAAGHLVEQGHGTFNNMKSEFASLVQGLQDFQWEQIPSAVIDYVKKNPHTTILQLVCLLVIVCPGLVATPGLLALGFGSEGPMAASLAAAFQSAFGTPLPFSVLQSAAMGGDGMAVVAPIVQVAAAGVVVAAEVSKWQSKEEQKTEDKEA